MKNVFHAVILSLYFFVFLISEATFNLYLSWDRIVPQFLFLSILNTLSFIYLLRNNEKIKIRLSDFTDCEHLFNWRSDKLSRSMFLKESTPSIEEHMAWFENSLCNPDRTIYIGEIGDKRIGMCRFDFIKSELLTGVYASTFPYLRKSSMRSNIFVSPRPPNKYMERERERGTFTYFM